MINEDDLKPIPYGVTDFNDFRVKNYYYVDKTRFIRDIEKKGKFLFLIRPRRFGKSLFLGIMEAYYDIAYKDRFDYFFMDSAVHQNPTAEKNSYLVFKLNFSLVNPDISLVEGSFLHYIRESALSFITKYEKLLGIDIKETKTGFDSQKSASDVMITLLRYCNVKKQKLYVIIDEYDNFANTILSEAGEKEFTNITHGTGFFRAFFNVVKGGTTDTEAPISRLFMTGVSPITLDDVTSGFNIATNISLHSDINEIMGFTRTEVETMIEYYRQSGKIRHSTPQLLEIMNQWYNHYRFSRFAAREVFNTIHVLYFLKEYMIDSQIPDSLIDHNARIDYLKLRHLIIIDQKGTARANGNFSILQQIMSAGSLHSPIIKSFSMEDLTNPNHFISLLYYFGLLTIGGIDEENTPVLTIPNETVKRLYYDYFKDTYRETGVISLDMFQYGELVKGLAFRGNWRELVEYIAGRMEASLSLRDLISGEKALQVFWNVYLGLGPWYNVYAEREMGQGYCDLALVPLLIQYPTIKYSYLVEFKYIKPSENKPGNPQLIEKLKTEAESQLERYSPDEKFQKAIGQTRLKGLVLIFCGHRLVYKGEAQPGKSS